MENEAGDSLTNATEVAKGTFWGLAGNFFLKIVSFLYAIYIARAVSQGEIGLFYLSISIVGLFGSLKDFGLPSAISRYVPYFEGRGENEKADALLAWGYAINVASGVFFTVIFFIGAGVIGDLYRSPALGDALRLISVFMLIENIGKVNAGYLQGKSDIKSSQLLTNFQNISKLVLTVLLVEAYGASVATLIAGFVISSLASTVWGLAMIRKKIPNTITLLKTRSLSSAYLFREIVPFGIMLSALTLFSTLISYADKIFLGYLLPPSAAAQAVAVYSMATLLAINITIFQGAVGGIFMPLISRLAGKNDSNGMKKIMKTAQRWSVFITIPVAIVMIAFSEEMLASFYGQPYAAGKASMVIFLVGLLIASISYISLIALAGLRMVNLEFRVVMISGIVNAILNVLLIPIMGMEGAAVASAISFCISTALFEYYARKIIGYSTPPEVYRMVLAGALTFTLIFALKPIITQAALSLLDALGWQAQGYTWKIIYLFLLGLVVAFSYSVFGALSIAFKCLGTEEIAMVKNASKKAGVPEGIVKIAEELLSYGTTPAKK